MLVKMTVFLNLSLASVGQRLLYDILALNDDRTLVIRIAMYERIFVMLTEFRTGGGA